MDNRFVMTTGEAKGLDCRARRLERLDAFLRERNLVMGVLNATPDSFSDGGLFLDPMAALDQALRMEAEGADLLDVGGESSRPGADEVSAAEEIRRVVPVIRAIREKSDIPLSIDTRRIETAKEAFAAGADMVNDITALRDSPGIPAFVAEEGGGLILMHMRGTPKNMQDRTDYTELIGETRSFLSDRAKAAAAAGVPSPRIWLDPGIGFGKSVEGNLEILANLYEYDSLDHPLVIGISRKSFIGKILDRPVENRLAGALGLTGAIASDGIRRVYRVHDVAPMADSLRIVEAWGREKRP